MIIALKISSFYREEIPGVELVKFGERFSGDIDANTELSLITGMRKV